MCFRISNSFRGDVFCTFISHRYGPNYFWMGIYIWIYYKYIFSMADKCICATLHWRQNDHDGVSNHQPHVCLLNRLFRRRSKKTSKLHVTGLCVGNSPGRVKRVACCYDLLNCWWFCMLFCKLMPLFNLIDSFNFSKHILYLSLIKNLRRARS